MKNYHIYTVLILSLLLAMNFISAIDLKVEAKAVSNNVIPEIDKPAVFDLTLENRDLDDTFTIYSLVGIDITPKDPIAIKHGEKKTIRIEVMPQYSIKSKRGIFTVQYKIKNAEDELQEESLTIDIVGIEDAFNVNADDITMSTYSVNINMRNIVDSDFAEVDFKASSPFFEYNEKFPVKGYESKTIAIPIDKNKLKEYNAGNYLIKIEILADGKKVYKTIDLKYVPQENIDTRDTNTGFFVNKRQVTKTNLGNVQTPVEIRVEKSILSYLFTTQNVYPSESGFNGLRRYYVWKSQLSPNQNLDVRVTTNWFYPILIVILFVAVLLLIKRFVEMDMVLRKDVSFVRTKGGEFALKVSIRVRAKRYLENIKIVDRLPLLVHLYDKFGAVQPDRVDLKNKKLEWDVKEMGAGQERIFSYIVYSKIGVVGKFERQVQELYLIEKELRRKLYLTRHSMLIKLRST